MLTPRRRSVVASRPSRSAPQRPPRAPAPASTTSRLQCRIPSRAPTNLPAVETPTVERPRTSGPDSGLGGNWMVIVQNDNHNTFEHVAQTLARVIPGISIEQGHRFADTIHN